MIETIGVIGGGQLGRMFALDAKRMGYEVIALDPQPGSPCGQVSDEQIVAAYDDLDAVDQLGKRADVVTYEFENIAIASVQRLEQQGYPVAPGSDVLRITQNRIAEKTFVRECGIPVADFADVRDAEGARMACTLVGMPGVMKTATGGYDGKGQWRVQSLEDAQEAVVQAAGAQLVYERFIDFEREISVICTRGRNGEAIAYPPTENIHDNGILSISIAPARVDDDVAHRAQDYGERIGRALNIVGTFCVEMFLLRDGQLVVNEIAPRPHNSGHYTIDATRCSQYEQHVRAICGLPLSPPQLMRNAIMVNILGEGTGNRLAGTDRLLADPSIVLHVYGKKHAVKRRKMGHFTMLLETPVAQADVDRAIAARGLLSWE